MEQNKVGFALRKISTEEFATYESELIENQEVKLSAGINFGINTQSKVLACISRFEFILSENPLLLIQVKYEFEIEPNTWNSLMDKDLMKITFPKEFMHHLATISVGTTRGVLHAKTENSQYNALILPLINVTELIRENMSFDLSKTL